MNKKAIGEAIKKYRKHVNITQKQLAKMIEKSESTIQKYESGEIEAPLSVLEQISDCLGLEVIELLEADSDQNVIDYWGKTDSALFEYCKALGYEFKRHPDSDYHELLIHYGYSYDIPTDDWLRFIDDVKWDVKERFNELMKKYASSKKIIKE
ncbi:helix-turn-helix domain-containing protein [Lacrimispora sp. JR3]|uniref:helix-turn-helix domain-containing protein n=1 Tax=Lacrimispora sinapis TaxID=3111456 RepID=UPI0037479471